jgi:hypothetical protein
LHQRVLDVSWLFVVVKVFRELLVGQMAPKPSAPPEKKRHEDYKPTGGKKKKFLGARHAALGLCGNGF